MTRVMMLLFSMISTTLMGIGVVAALTAGYDTTRPIVIAVILGFVLALPVSYFVAKAISE